MDAQAWCGVAAWITADGRVAAYCAAIRAACTHTSVESRTVASQRSRAIEEQGIGFRSVS